MPRYPGPGDLGFLAGGTTCGPQSGPQPCDETSDQAWPRRSPQDYGDAARMTAFYKKLFGAVGLVLAAALGFVVWEVFFDQGGPHHPRVFGPPAKTSWRPSGAQRRTDPRTSRRPRKVGGLRAGMTIPPPNASRRRRPPKFSRTPTWASKFLIEKVG